MDLLIFLLDGHRYGVRLVTVVEVIRAVWIAPLPGAPAIVEGAIDYRGTVVPVLDLRARFGHAPRSLEASDRFVVARASGRLVAVRTDEVGWPVRVEQETLNDLVGSVGDARYVGGVVKLPDGLIVIHDLETFLSSTESMELASVMPGTSSSGDATAHDDASHIG